MVESSNESIYKCFECLYLRTNCFSQQRHTSATHTHQRHSYTPALHLHTSATPTHQRHTYTPAPHLRTSTTPTHQRHTYTPAPHLHTSATLTYRRVVRARCVWVSVHALNSCDSDVGDAVLSGGRESNVIKCCFRGLVLIDTNIKTRIT